MKGDKEVIITDNIAYTDGSFNGKEMGCGIVIFIDGKKITESFKSDNQLFLPM